MEIWNSNIEHQNSTSVYILSQVVKLKIQPHATRSFAYPLCHLRWRCKSRIWLIEYLTFQQVEYFTL
jgi:hypothetical protein